MTIQSTRPTNRAVRPRTDGPTELADRIAGDVYFPASPAMTRRAPVSIC